MMPDKSVNPDAPSGCLLALREGQVHSSVARRAGTPVTSYRQV